MIHDVVVVGAGPAGCYAASLLAQKGLEVHVLEEHSAVGEPVDCSGVVGAESFSSLKLPNSLRLGSIDSIEFLSPSGLKVRFSRPSPLAYVIDRSSFDQYIGQCAVSAGAVLHLGWRVVDVALHKDGIEAVVEEAEGNSRGPRARNRKVVKAKAMILAHGPRYHFQRAFGMGEPGEYLKTSQVEVPVHGIKDTWVLLGSQVAPGSFGWVVPLKKGGREFARVGVTSRRPASPFLKQVLKKLHSMDHLDDDDVPVRSWVIPVAPLKKTFAERVLAVGDAAGQTKPTTGGGIYYALLSARAAAGTISMGLARGDLSSEAMSHYQREWRKRLGREIKFGAAFRYLVERLTDAELDDLFRVVNSDGILKTITGKARFDWHTDVIYFALRHPALGSLFLKGLFR